MVKLLVNKIREINPLAKRGMLLLLALLASLACLLGPRDSEAAPTINDSWTSVYAATATGTTVNVNSSSFAVSNGSKRLLLVAVEYEGGTTAGTFSAHSVTYGGVTVNPIATTTTTSSRIHTWLGYVKDADIPAGLNAVNVTATRSQTLTGIQIKAGSYNGVDQDAPISSSASRYVLSAAIPFPSAIAYPDNSITIIASNNAGTAVAFTTTTVTGGADFSEQAGATTTTGGFFGNIAESGLNATAGTYTTATTVTYTGTTTARSSMVVATLNPYIAVTTGTVAGTATAVNGGLNSINVFAPYGEDSNSDNALRVEYKLTADPDTAYVVWTGSDLPHSNSPYSTSITGLATGSSYAVRITYLDPVDGVTGTPVQTITGVITAGIPAQNTFYMTRNTTTDLIADGVCNVTGLTPFTSTGLGKTTTDYVEFGTASRYYPATIAGTGTILNVYTPAYTSNAVDISNISASIAFQGINNTNTIKLDLYNYDPDGAAGNGTLVASSTAKTVTGGATLTRYTWAPADFTINGSGRVTQGHRLQFRLTQYSNTAGTSRVYFGATGNTSSTNFTVTQTPVAGSNYTTTGTVTAVSAGTTSISVSAPYTDDSNANNTLRVEYKLTAEPDTSYVKWTDQDLSHAASPYTAVITGLTKGASYAVRFTYLDPVDGVTGTPVQTITGVIPAAVPVQNAYYMTRNTTTDLGADGTSNITGVSPYTATGIGKTTTLAAELGTGSRYYPDVVVGSNTILNVYTPVYTDKAVDISGISASIAFRGAAATASDLISLELYDYDPNGAAGNGTLVASSTTKQVTSATAQVQYSWVPANFTINGTGTVALNHRLQFRVKYSSTVAALGSNTAAPLPARLYFGVAGALTSTNFRVTETPAAGASLTTAGTATAMAVGASRIKVTAPYTDDGNANNTLRVEYKLSIDPDANYVRWTGRDLDHSDTPYMTQITGLNAGTSYDVRVTYLDTVDGVSGTAVQVISGITTPQPGVEAYQDWTRVINDSTTHATGMAVNLTGNFAVTTPAGNNRLLVLAITQANRAANTAPGVPTTVSFGGVNLKLATSNRATSSRAHTWLYYLKDNSVMDGTSRPVVVNWASGVAATKIDVACAVFIGVDQIPAYYTTGTQIVAQTGTTAMSLNAAMPVIANAKAIYVLNVANVVTATIPTYTTNANWTTPLSVSPTTYTGNVGTNYSYSIQLADRLIPVSDTTDAATTGTRSITSYYAMSAMVLPPLALAVTDGAAVPNSNVYAGDTSKVVDAFTLQGSASLTNIQVTGNADATPANVSEIRIYRKGNASTTVYTPGVDTLIGTGTFATNPANITVSESVSATTNYIIVYDIDSGATADGTAKTLTGKVTSITPVASSIADNSATALTILATVTLGTGVEPPAARLWKSSLATRLDAFTLSHNGTSSDNDVIGTVTVTLTPQYISGGSGGTVSKFKLVEIVNAAGNVVYGSANLPTGGGDNWNIPTTQHPTERIVVTSTETTYYVRVTTADEIVPLSSDASCNAPCTGYYSPIKGTITSLLHDVGTNKLVLGDLASASLTIDMEKPIGPPAGSVVATTGTNGGEINLVWGSVSDDHGGTIADPKSVVIIRSAGDGTAPDPGCSSIASGAKDLSTVGTVTINYNGGNGGSVTDNNLISTTPTRYYYRVCAKDSQGNLSDGLTSYANAKTINVCNTTPTVELNGEDMISTSQVIKSANSTPFKLQMSNNDMGICPDVDFNVTLVDEVNAEHFDKRIGATPETAVPFPAVVKLGTGGAGAPTGKTLNVYVIGLPSAAQLEHYKFAVQVTGAGHGTPPQTALNDGILNDMPPIVHNASNMGKFQYNIGGVNWGQTYTCATCHSNSTTNIKGIFTLISTPIGRRNVVFSKTSSVESDPIGVMGNDVRPKPDTSDNVCSVCHHMTRQHQYSASKPFGGPNNDEPYNRDHHNSRDCVRCHTHNSAFRSIFGVCGDCHGFRATGYSPINKQTMAKPPTNALGGTPPNYGAHQVHYTAKMTCAVCHSTTNHGLNTTAWSGDTILEIGFNINKDSFSGFNPLTSSVGGTFYGTNNLNTPYTWWPGPNTIISPIADYNASCNTYCHGQWDNNAGSNTTPIWVGTGQAACGTCHNATGAVPPLSGSHKKHTAKGVEGYGGLGIKCDKCHSTYSSFSTVHINGNVEWSMKAYSGSTYKGVVKGSTNNKAPGLAADYGTCTNLYCHSNVQGADGIGKPTRYGTPKWGTTTSCGSCHDEPNQTGSHASHENQTVSFDCHVCHNNGGTTTSLNHADGHINLQFVGLGQNTVYSKGVSVDPGSGYGTCGTSDCHGRYTRSWGTNSSELDLCDKCHGSATSARGFYNTQGPDGTLSVYSTGVGVHDIHLQNPNSPRKATFSRFTSYAAGFKCIQCHNTPKDPFSAGHLQSILPAELVFGNLSSIAYTGKTFYGYTSMPKYSGDLTKTCSAVWCHGAGMQSNRSYGAYSGASIPVTNSKPVWNVPFLTGDGATDCNKCHATPPPAPDSSFTHYGKTLTTCKDCHQHVSDDGHGFKKRSLHVNGTVEGDCNECHGTPPINNIPGDKHGLVDPPLNALNGGAGAHNAHLQLPFINSNAKPCYICHNNYTPEMPSNLLDIGFGPLAGNAVTGTFTGYSAIEGGPKWHSTTAGTTILKSPDPGAICSNIYCHGGGTGSLPALGGGASTTPDWEGAVACGDCHGTDSGNTPNGGSHQRHAQLIPSLSCQTCHGTTSENGTHVNASVSWNLQRTDALIGPLATYNNLSAGSIPGFAPRSNQTREYSNCNNFYCHSNVQSANGTAGPTVYGTPKWGNNGTMNCTSCHKDPATDGTADNSHVKHANTASGMGISCGYCHQDAGFGYDLHTDGYVFVNFTSYIGGAYSVGTVLSTGMNKRAGTAAYGSCAATFCHGDASSPVWNSNHPTGLACNECHAAKVDDTSWSGNHKIHYNYSTMPSNYTQTLNKDLSDPNKYRFNCAHCHDDNVAKHSLKPASADSAARVFFGISTATPASSSRRGIYVPGAPAGSTDNGFYFTAGSCNTSYCHSNGKRGEPINKSLTWTTAKGSSNCLYCHDGKSSTSTATTLSGKHDKHMNPLNNAIMGTGNGFNCSDCHSPSITNNTNVTITNKGRHVNAMLDYSGAKAYKTYSDGKCSYCHSNGNPGALVFVNMTGSKVWTSATGAITTCNKCHGRSNSTGYPDYANVGGAANANSNLHAGHMAGLTDTTACADCHRRTAETAVPNRFRPYTTMHLNGSPDVSFNTAKSYIGAKATVDKVGNYQVTCSNVLCHGQGKPVWGATANVGTCQKCHGSKSTAFQTYTSPQVAPGVSGGTDTYTNTLATSPRVGAHERHLSPTLNVISGPVKCRECHIPVTNVRAASHWNYTTATVSMGAPGSIASAFTHSPAPSRSGGIIQCSNTACHAGKTGTGTSMAPLWNSTTLVDEAGTTVAACVQCHAMAPTGVTGHTTLTTSTALSSIYTTCGSCHDNLSNSATNVTNVFNNKNLHVNGVMDAVGGACNGCHDYDNNAGTWGLVKNKNYGGTTAIEGRGAHYKHIEYLKAKYNVTLDPANDTWASAGYKRVCGTCHSLDDANDHSMGNGAAPRSITFGDNGTNPRNFGTPGTPAYGGNYATSSANNPKSCSNTDCHYKVTPVWSTY